MTDPLKQLEQMTESFDSIWARACAPPDLSQCKGWLAFEKWPDQKKKKAEKPK